MFHSCRQAQVPQHIGWYGPEGQFHGRAREVLASFAGGDAFRVMAGMYQKDLYALVIPCSGMCKAGISGARFAACSLRCLQARDARITAGMDQEGLHQVRRHPLRGAEAVSHGPDCSSDHRHSPVAEHGGPCPCCAVRQFSSADVEETVELPQLQLVELRTGGFLRALYTGTGPGVVSTGTRLPY